MSARADLVLADVSPRELVRIARGRLPERYARAPLLRYRPGPGAFKVGWALAGAIPWRAPPELEVRPLSVTVPVIAVTRSSA